MSDTALVAERALFLLTGPFAGDYVATLASAWPRAPRPILGRSCCARCGAAIAASRAIPLVSWAMLGGRRACCAGRIPVIYPLGEATGLVSGLAAALQPSLPLVAWSFGLGLALAYVALVDLRRFSIPWWGLAALALAFCLALAAEPTTGARLARLATGGALALAFETLRRFAGRGGRRLGLGAGDVLLAALLGGLVGWRLAAPMVSLAALAPLAIQVIRRRFGPTPFGFWLCVSAGVLLLMVEAASALQMPAF
ncbi:MAG TPA: prepilin peptidase [Caulobacteraceae bacterium]|nr:prepilin peptidase [Caulobacteraceae bacterium]